MFQLVMSVALAAAAAPQVQAIGPKQDDPLAICELDHGGIIGPERQLAIGPKQDDPRKGILVQGGKQASFNPETDPHANGGAEMIGPKQDDPRQSLTLPVSKLAIGPKQDDPRSPGQLAVGAYNPETDPHAKSSSKCKKKD